MFPCHDVIMRSFWIRKSIYNLPENLEYNGWHIITVVDCQWIGSAFQSKCTHSPIYTIKYATTINTQSHLTFPFLQYIPWIMSMVYTSLCFIVVVYQNNLPISFRITSLALGQSCDCPSVSGVTLKDMGKHIKWIHKKPKQNVQEHVHILWDIL